MSNRILRSARPAMVAAAVFTLCAALAGPSLAQDSSEPYPDSDDCRSIWNASSAKATCSRNVILGTKPGFCIVTADCSDSNRYSATTAVHAGCYLTGCSAGVNCLYVCTSTVDYEADDDVDILNCSTRLRVGSDCTSDDTS